MKKKLFLNDPYPIHWRTNADGYEYIMRTIFHMKGINSLAEAERKMWLTKGWEKRLEALRVRHRSAGIPDERFFHPDQK